MTCMTDTTTAVDITCVGDIAFADAQCLLAARQFPVLGIGGVGGHDLHRHLPGFMVGAGCQGQQRKQGEQFHFHSVILSLAAQRLL